MPLPYPIQLPFSLKSKHPFTSLGPDGLLFIHVPKYSPTLPVLAQDSHFIPAECGQKGTWCIPRGRERGGPVTVVDAALVPPVSPHPYHFTSHGVNSNCQPCSFTALWLSVFQELILPTCMQTREAQENLNQWLRKTGISNTSDLMFLIWSRADMYVLPWRSDFPSGIKLQLPIVVTWLYTLCWRPSLPCHTSVFPGEVFWDPLPNKLLKVESLYTGLVHG